MPSYASDRPWPGASSWSDPLSRDALEAVAQGSRRMIGFQVCAINVLHRDRFRTVAVAGDDEAREALMDSELESTVLLYELTRADRWGTRFRFVPAERAGQGRAWGWSPVVEKPLVGDAWDPEDLLIAPLFDGPGEMIGMLSVDVSVDGLRPGPEIHSSLDAYAEQVELTLRVALDRDEVAERERLGGVVRDIVRIAMGSTSLPNIWANCERPVLEGFAAREVWAHQILGEDHFSPSHPFSEVSELRMASREVAQKMWAEQAVRPRGMRKTTPEYRCVDMTPEAVEVLASHDADRLLMVPLGSGEECVGLLTLVRGRTDPPWSTTEQRLALVLGHDFGHALFTAWSNEQREDLVVRLRETNESRKNLVATLTHELKSPITVLRAHLESLEEPGEDQLPRALPPMRRAVTRLTTMVDDLLLLARLQATATPVLRQPVDLTEIAAQALAEYADVAALNGQQISLESDEADPDSWWALADPNDLRVVASNLVSNALKYTPTGGRVRLRVAREGPDHIVLDCIDDGIGIASEDVAALFEEFVRAEDPRARSQPGAGLGLSIVRRLVHLNNGRIEVDSELNGGSTFRVLLPRSDAGTAEAAELP